MAIKFNLTISESSVHGQPENSTWPVSSTWSNQTDSLSNWLTMYLTHYLTDSLSDRLTIISILTHTRLIKTNSGIGALQPEKSKSQVVKSAWESKIQVFAIFG